MTAGTNELDRWLHDLRNQVSVILGFSEMLLGELEQGDAKRSDIREIHLAAARVMDALSHPPLADERHS